MTDFSLITAAIAIAAVLGIVVRLLKQPALVGYLVAGILLANLLPQFSSHLELFGTFSQLGIALLLFLVGLEMNLKQLPSIGKVAAFVASGEMLFVFLLSAVVSLILGFSFPAAVYLGLGLAFSSTIVVVKLLSEKQDLVTLHGRIVIGILLVQDLVAILALVFLAGYSNPTGLSPASFLLVLVKAALLFLLVYFLGKTLLPWLFDRIAAYPELLFVTSLAWALGLSALVSLPQIGLSIEIGGFLAGLVLAQSTQSLEIAARIRPLRDFFLTLFFLSLGAHLQFASLNLLLFPALAFSLIVLFAKPAILASLMGLSSFRRRTSFLVGISLSQISEFSFILVGLGVSLGHLDSSALSLITFVGAVTMIISTYSTLHASNWYIKLRHFLKIIERQHTKESIWHPPTIPTRHLLLLGCDRTGRNLLPVLSRRPEPLLIVDSNPQVVGRLMADGFTAMYGDISDPELLEEIHLTQAALVISTVADLTDNLLILEKIKSHSPRPLTIMVADNPRTALRLYEASADYVIVPRLLGGEHLSRLLSSSTDRSGFEKLRQKQLKHLNHKL